MAREAVPPRFWAIVQDELQKNWARRGRALIIALVLLVAGTGLFSWHTYHSFENSQQNSQQAVAQTRQQIARTEAEIKTAPPSKRAALKQEVAQDSAMLQQMQTSSGGAAVNEPAQIRSLASGLTSIPKDQRGPTLEQLMLARYRVAHGQSVYNPAVDGGWRLVGLVFSGQALILFALLAVVMASDAVSAELQSGTWGILLLHAPRRIQLYLAKWSAALITVWLWVAASAVGLFLLASALMGIGSPWSPHVLGPRLVAVQQGGGVPTVSVAVQNFHLIPQWSFDLLALGLAMLTLGGLVTVLMALSVLTRSTVWSLIIGVLLVISGIFAPILGHYGVYDPALSLPLMAVWTGSLALQDNILSFNMPTALLVTGLWACAALVAGSWRAQYTDV